MQYGIALDRMFCLPDGSIEVVAPGYIQSMAMATLFPGATGESLLTAKGMS